MEPKDLVIQPNGDRYYIYLDEVPDKAGMIYMAETQRLPSRLGTVLACGDEAKKYVAGDRILISSFSGVNLYLWQYGIRDERYRIVTEGEILGRIEQE